MKKRSFFPFLLLFILLVYTLVFPRGIEPRLGIRPSWALGPQQLSGSGFVHKGDIKGALVPFRLKTVSGYLDQRGEILSLLPNQQLSAFSRNGYMRSSGDKGGWYTPDGVLYALGPGDDLPFMTDNGRYALAPDRSRISEIGDDGTPVWTRHVKALLSCFADNGAYRLFGTVEGEAFLLDRHGKEVERFYPQFPGVKGIYGAAVSSEGNRIALICQAKPQMLLLYEYVEGAWQIRNEWKLPGALLRESEVKFLHGGAVLQMERGSELLTLDVLSGSFTRHQLKGRFLDSHEIENFSLSVMASYGPENYCTVLDDGGQLLFQLPLSRSPWTLASMNSGAVLGFERSLGGMLFEKR